MGRRRLNIKTLWILAILNVFCHSVFSQSGHVSKWNFSQYLVSFDAGGVHVEEDESFEDKFIMYVDADGKIKLVYDGFRICNEKFEPVVGSEMLNDSESFVVPVPGSANLVYCFVSGGFEYYLLDLEKNEIVSDRVPLSEFENIPLTEVCRYILVHHANCNDVWLIHYGSEVMYKYLITSIGVEYRGMEFINNKVTNAMEPCVFFIRLSRDCKHYTASYIGKSEDVLYGDFDMETGCFYKKSECEIPTRHGGTREVITSFVSVDNQTIFLYCELINEEHQFRREILSVDIVNGVPDYENFHVLYSTVTHGFGYVSSDVIYGLDGNIYLSDHAMCKIFKLIPTAGSKYTVEDDFLTFPLTGSGTISEMFLADWFSPNPCGEDFPCPEKKKIKIICE